MVLKRDEVAWPQMARLPPPYLRQDLRQEDMHRTPLAGVQLLGKIPPLTDLSD